MKKIVKGLQQFCRVLELVVAFFVLIGIILAIVSLFRADIQIFEELTTDITVFRHYLEKIFVLVIGIEFLEMLCHPTPDNVIQVLIFLVARHMIVGETTPYEDFVSVLSITVLIILRKYMHNSHKKAKEESASPVKPGEHEQVH